MFLSSVLSRRPDVVLILELFHAPLEHSRGRVVAFGPLRPLSAARPVLADFSEGPGLGLLAGRRRLGVRLLVVRLNSRVVVVVDDLLVCRRRLLDVVGVAVLCVAQRSKTETGAHVLVVDLAVYNQLLVLPVAVLDPVPTAKVKSNAHVTGHAERAVQPCLATVCRRLGLGLWEQHFCQQRFGLSALFVPLLAFSGRYVRRDVDDHCRQYLFCGQNKIRQIRRAHRDAASYTVALLEDSRAH